MKKLLRGCVEGIQPEIGESLRPEAETELVRACKTGKPRSFAPLVHAYEGPGMRVALGMLGNTEDASDAVQQAFVKAWKSLDRFDTARRFGPWFFQILRNQCRDALRTRAARFKMEVLDEQLEMKPAGAESNPEHNQTRNAAHALLWKGLGAIAPDHREILVLKELEGFRYSEIAEVLEIPDGTVASRLYHARRALKDALESLPATYP